MEKLNQTLTDLLNQKSSSKELKKALAVVYDEADRRRKIFESILSSVPDLVFLFDRNHRLHYANKSLLERFELDLEEAVGKTIEELEAQDNLPLAKELHDDIDQVFKVGEEARDLIYSKDKTRAYDYILVPVLSNHQPQMVAGSCRDITDRLEIERELEEKLNEHRRSEEALQKSEQRYRELSQTLEKRVAQRTDEINKKKDLLSSLTAELVATEQRERQKLASILHDDLQQLLLSARLHLSTIDKNYEDDLEIIIQIIDRANQVARNLSNSLSSQKLYEKGLKSALQWLKRKMKEYHYLDVELDVEAENINDNLDVEIGIMLFECIRELLLNVFKHAHADSATLQVYTKGEILRVRVMDEGVGCDPKILQDDIEETFGLYNIKNRIEAIGGVFEFDSAPGHGTHVRIAVPFAGV